MDNLKNNYLSGITNLQARHAQACAEDVARLATLIIDGRGEQKPFVRRACTSRRYNHEHFPAQAIDVGKIFSDACSGTPYNFRETFEIVQRAPRLNTSVQGARHELICRILADSTPYLDPLMRWMERNSTTGLFARYTKPEYAVRLLYQPNITALRTEAELTSMIDRGLRLMRAAV